MQSRLKPLALRHSDQEEGVYAIFCEDGGLYRYDSGGDACSLVTNLPAALDYEGPYRIDYCHPLVCVSQRFGLRCAVVDLRNCLIKEFSREDYHADVSSYSIGFLRREEHQLFVHQTEWNRLEITDLRTSGCLNPKNVDGGASDENNEALIPDYLDYFHSLLHVSPDGRTILSNGWIWHPVGVVRCYSIEQLQEGRENEHFDLVCDSNHNWDRPCTFIDGDLFVIAADDNANSDAYQQLWFFRLSDHRPGDQQLRPCKKVVCDAFPKNEGGEVHGELYYDPALKRLIAISSGGSSVLPVDGQVQSRRPEAVGFEYSNRFDYQRTSPEVIEWQYNTVDHCLYTWDVETGRLTTVELSREA